MESLMDYKTEPGSLREGAAETLIDPTGDEVSLVEILIALARRKRMIGVTTGALTALGVAVSLILPPRYTAVTKLMPPQQAQSASALLMTQLSSAGINPLASVGAGLGLKNPNDIYVGMLTSRPVADAIIAKFDLKRAYHDRDMTAARKDLAKNTEILSEKSGFIAVSVTDRDKLRSAAIANEYTTQLRLLTKGIAVTEAAQRRLFYETQLKDAKDALVIAEASFQAVQQNKGVIQPDAQARALIEGLASLHAQIAAKEVSIEAMRSYSTERNPDVGIAERELASLKDQANRLEQRGHPAGSSDLTFRDVPQAGLEYLRAQHEVQYRQALFDLLIKQYDAARIDEAKEAAIIQVVEPAIEPDQKTSPKRALITIIFCLTGFLLSCLAALALWRKETLEALPEYSRPISELKVALFGGRNGSVDSVADGTLRRV